MKHNLIFTSLIITKYVANNATLSTVYHFFLTSIWEHLRTKIIWCKYRNKSDTHKETWFPTLWYLRDERLRTGMYLSDNFIVLGSLHLQWMKNIIVSITIFQLVDTISSRVLKVKVTIVVKFLLNRDIKSTLAYMKIYRYFWLHK